MRALLLGSILALAMAGSAAASDFVVLSSTDPAFKPGQQLMGGSSLRLAAGSQLTVIHASGMVRKLNAGANGAVQLPQVAASSANARRTEVLKLMVAQPRRTRSLVPPACPAPETLTTLDEILAAAEQEPCLPLARQALAAYAEKAAE